MREMTSEAVMLDLVQPLATRGSLSVLSEGTARALEHLRCLGECGRRSRRDDGRERALRHRQHYGSRPCLQQRASPSARGKERRSGVSSDLCGDELVSQGFRVGNPSAIGRHQRVNFPASLLPVGATPTTSRRIATRSLRRKIARSPSRSGGRTAPSSAPQEGAETIPGGGVFFCAQAPAPFPGPGWLQLGACNTRSSLGVSNAFTVVQKIALTAIVDQADNSNKRPLLGGGPMAKPPCGQLGRIALQVRPKSPRRKID